MRVERNTAILAVWSMVGAAACGVPILDRWSGRPVLEREVSTPPDTLWERLSRGARTLGLTIAELRPEDGVLGLDWITAPGDGRLYLRCRGGGPVGSASIRPRISIVPAPGGSRITIGSRVRGTTTSACISTGQLEDWLLERLVPATPELAEPPPPGGAGGSRR